MAKRHFARALAEVERLLDADDEARAGALEELAREDAALAAEVRELLARAVTGSADGALVARARREAAKLLAGVEPTPERVGRFRLIALLGRGGMGAVYRAEQERPRREVALKLLLSTSATSDVAARFAREAEVLARLSHPGIARIYDAGVDSSGSPPRAWIAMELVEGQPITDGAARAKLGLRERASLLADVCEAVAHAHEKGVLHRDLKPANVLVGEDGRPRVLDFGVARLLEEEGQPSASFATAEGHLVGTLSYMSPEQAAGEALDARSDVFALGLLGYELLTGQRAQDVSGLPVARALQRVQEAELRPAQSVAPALRGDLATILGKALRREREQRYESAAALAADLRRFLAHEPIAARPASATYQLRKFARRNKALVGGTLATVVALALGLVGTSVQAARAEREAELARTSERHAKEAAGVLLELFRAGQTHVPGGKRPLEEIVLKGRAALERALLDAPLERAELLGMLGEALLFAGDYGQARELLLEALALRAEHAPEDEAGSWRLHYDLGPVATRLGLDEEAERHLRRALELLRARGDDELDRSRMYAGLNLASLLCDQERHAETLPLRRESLEVARRVYRKEEPRMAFLLALEEHHVAPSDASFATLREAGELALASPLRAEVLRLLANAALLYGRERQDVSLVREALGWADESLSIELGRVGREKEVTWALQVMSVCYEALGQPEAMLALAQEIVRLVESGAATPRERSLALANLGQSHFVLRENAAALALLERARALYPIQTLDQLFILSDLREWAGDLRGSVEARCEAKALVIDSRVDDPVTFAAIDARLGVAALLAGDAALAEAVLRDVLETRRRNGESAVRLASSEQLHGWALLRLGRAAEAAPLIERGSQGLLPTNGPKTPRGQLCVRSLVELHEALGDEDEAARWRAQLPAGG